MNLLEHEAKQLLHSHQIAVPRSWLVTDATSLPDDVAYPVIAKSQVPVGGRGKAGGIIEVLDESDLERTCKTIFELSIKGHEPSAILLEEKLTASRELYLSLRLDRDTRSIEWLASPEGGIDIEDNASTIRSFALGDIAQIAHHLGADPETLAPLAENLLRAFRETELLLLEINPLIEQENGSLICADAKVLVDDNAKFRQPALPWPSTEGNPPKPLGGVAEMLEKVKQLGLDPSELRRKNSERDVAEATSSKDSEGLATQSKPDDRFLGDSGQYIGCIANGAGMAMSTMDTIVAMGGRPANFLDIGGGTGEAEFVTAMKQIKELPGVTSIIVNIFAGISRCDEIARGIIAARNQLPDLPPLFIRLEGTNRDIAARLLREANIAIEPDLKTCVQKAMEITA